MVAKIKIPRGTRILAEEPLFRTITSNSLDVNAWDKETIKEVKKLDKDEQRQFFSLNNPHRKEMNPIFDIASSNMHPINPNGTINGLFL